MAPKITITKTEPIEALQKLTAFNLDDYVAGKSMVWTFWDCAPSEFPWTYSKNEYAYVLAGQFYVTYEGGEPVEINAGDFVHFPPGQTHFKVTVPVRKFFTLV
ncbi:hypothetical protein COCOBI_08-5460 [Coccomyxa sp. Obi]|nr:hypothetical protein COCOBI_08-5460 [Coccomyxa sp. Obi]